MEATSQLDTGVAKRFEAAATYSDVDSNGLRRAQASAEAALSTLRDADEKLAQIDADTRLNDRTKRERQTQVRTEAEASAGEKLAMVQQEVEALVRNYTAPLTAPAPKMDGTLLEAKLANARHDVELALSNEPPEEIVDALTELATDDDEVMRYLLLGTEYPMRLLRGRELAWFMPMWKRRRELLLREQLGESAPRGVDAAEKLQDVPLLLKHRLAAWVGKQ